MSAVGINYNLTDLWILLTPPPIISELSAACAAVTFSAMNLFVIMGSSRLQVLVTVGPPSNQESQETSQELNYLYLLSLLRPIAPSGWMC